MKLAKKMLACAMALAMVAAFALTAFAAAPVVSLTADQYANVGDEVKVVVAGKNIVGLEAADLEFAYDAEALEFVSVEAGSSDFIPVSGSPKAGMVTFSLMYLEAAKADVTFCTITFKVLKAGDTDVTVKYNSWAGTDEPAAAKVTVAQKEVTTEAPVVTTEAPVVTTEAPVVTTEAGSEVPTKNDIPETGEAGVAAIAGVMALAAVAFVATRKKDEE